MTHSSRKATIGSIRRMAPTSDTRRTSRKQLEQELRFEKSTETLASWSLHSGGTPIQLPGMPYPDRWYYTRYGLSLLPLLAFSVAVMTISVAPRRRRVALCVVILRSARNASLTAMTVGSRHPAPAVA